MNNSMPVFNPTYYNEKNKKIIKNLLRQESPYDLQQFESILFSRLHGEPYIIKSIVTYYVEIYVDFLYFNYHYENLESWSQLTMYSPKNIFQGMISPFSPQTEVDFHFLNYNIGQFSSIEEWNQHCTNVNSTLKFIDVNGLEVVLQVKNLKEDIEILSNIIQKFFEIKNKESYTMEDFKNFENDLEKCKLKNEVYTNNMLYSIKGNVEYLSKYISTMRKEYETMDKTLTDLQVLKKNIEELQEENSKTKDFYLTTSGAVMALISIVSGNISLSSKNISLNYLLIFNASILFAILIFSVLFHSIYNSNEKTYPKNLVHFIGCLLLIIIVGLLFYA